MVFFRSLFSCSFFCKSLISSIYVNLGFFLTSFVFGFVSSFFWKGSLIFDTGVLFIGGGGGTLEGGGGGGGGGGPPQFETKTVGRLNTGSGS
jgi:hypothetical protein